MTHDLTFAEESFIPQEKTWSFFPMVFQFWRFFFGNQSKERWKTPVQITCDNIIHAPPDFPTTPWLPDMFFAEKASGEIQHIFPALFQTKWTKLDHPSQISRKKCYARFVCLDMFFSYSCLLASPDPLPGVYFPCLCHSQNPNIDPLPDVSTWKKNGPTN